MIKFFQRAENFQVIFYTHFIHIRLTRKIIRNELDHPQLFNIQLHTLVQLSKFEQICQGCVQCAMYTMELVHTTIASRSSIATQGLFALTERSRRASVKIVPRIVEITSYLTQEILVRYPYSLHL